MHRKLNILRHLYGEDDSGQPETLIEGDDALRQEYQALSEIKYHLDHKPRQRPDPSVLDNIFIAAAEAGATHTGRRDRIAMRPSRHLRVRTVGIVSSVLVVVVAGIGLGYLLHEDHTASPDVASSAVAEKSEAVPLAEAPEQQTAVEEIAEAPAVAPAVSRETASPAQGISDVPTVAFATPEETPERVPERVTPAERRNPTPVALEWDESEDVRRLQRRIGLIEARTTGTSWNAPVAPLNGLQQSDSGRASFRPAAQTPIGWDY